MKNLFAFCLGATLLAAPVLAQDDEKPLECLSCAVWNEALAPFKLHGSTYYVGTKGLSSVLVTGRGGHVLIDGGLPQSAPLIRKNIEALGFRMADVKVIVNSHAHWDHAGGLAALQRYSGAQVAASPAAARVLRAGTAGEDDPQFDPVRPVRIAKVEVAREIADGETLRVGDIALTPHFTPGHTPGGTSWTWRSCEGSDCVDIAYVDSLTAVSLPPYRYTGAGASALRQSIARVSALPCDIAIAAHPQFTSVFERLAMPESPRRFVDPGGCTRYAEGMRKWLDERLAKERAAPG